MHRTFSLLLLASPGWAFAQATDAGQLPFRFGDIVSISIPSSWHYVPPAPPDRITRDAQGIKVNFRLMPPISGSGYKLLEAQDTRLGTEPSNRLILTFEARTPHTRSVFESALVAPGSASAKAILEHSDNLPNTYRSFKLASEVKLLEAKIVARGKLICESYAIQYRINSKPYEAHSLVCPSEYGAIRLFLESTEPKANLQSPLLSTIASTVAQ